MSYNKPAPGQPMAYPPQQLPQQQPPYPAQLPPPYYPPNSAPNPPYPSQAVGWQPHHQGEVVIVTHAEDHHGDNGSGGGFAFNDKSIRRGFIRKVYLILCCQLAVTFSVVLLVSLVPGLRAIALANSWLFHVAYAVFIVVYIVLVCVTAARRKYPWNFLALGVFTAALTFVTAVISARFSTNAVLICLGVTAIVCLGVTLFAVQTRIDFTLCSGLLFGLCLVVFLFGLACGVSFFAYRGYADQLSARILDCVYGGLIALVLVLFLIFDTQRVVGGRQHNLSEEEYAFGALQLYMDVVFIFIVLLGLSGDR